MKTLARQQGVAVVTALLLTTLAVTIVASLFWQQQVQVRSMENQRLHLQTQWILRGALDWARVILRQDGQDNRDWTREDGVWATPLAETRLDQYVERERVEGEDYAATIAGQVFDAQSRYNLTNLQAGGDNVKAFGRLLTLLGLDAGLAQAAADLAQQSQNLQGAMPLQRVEDLAAAGFSPAAIERLRDYVVVLPERKGVNVNTAKAEVIAAIVDTMSLSDAQSLVVLRKGHPFSDITAFEGAQQVAGKPRLGEKPVTRTDYFLVLSQVRLDRAALESWALIKRGPRIPANSPTTIEWIREI